ncbi:MAG: alpha/beta fold hydrolase [Burkholderiaceae bacterium]
MPTQAIEAIESGTGGKPDASVIWLHGLGADGHDFEPVVPALRLPAGLSLRFIFPHAPVRPVTINMGMPMRAWYDIAELGGARQDEAGIRASQAILERLIERERSRGIAAARIVLAGFSQGGAIALHTGLRHPEALAGILAMSTWLPLDSTVAAERHPANASIPIFLAHGSHDEMVGIDRARRSREALIKNGYAPQWREYPMGHAVCEPELVDIGIWLAEVLRAPST